MLTNRKWEELDAFNSEDENAFTDSGDDSENFGDNGASAAGRRGMIEQALAHVREMAKTTMEPGKKYTTGALVFDSQLAKFGRVKKCTTEATLVGFFSGGTKEYGLNLSRDITKEPRLETRLASATKAAGQSEKFAKTDKIKSLALKPQELSIAATPPTTTKTAAAVTKKVGPAKAPAETKKRVIPVKAKAVAPAAKKTAKPAVKKTPLESVNPWSEFQLDPIADPNGYIKQNFPYLSNKQLAGLTGLSEHTIRRKMGEWGLKRSANK